MTGHLFGDRYQVGDTLGFGGMSEVHRGRDLRLGRDVAIKVLRADLARDPSFQARFRREAQNAAALNHPAIVAVYDTGETPGETGPIPYIVMEYVDGETLRDALKREGSLQPKRAMEIVADVCAALDFSHRHGIVHRDIKPANVMLTKVGAVKVMDFGIARAVADGQSTMTATAAVIGTAQYLSPEQARGEAVDARSDVYATGCVLFELLTGAPPFTGDSPVAVAYQHVREDPKPPSEVNPALPRELDAIVLKALNKNPLNRYQTAAEMRADLVRALSGQAVLATPVMSDEERTQLLRPGPMRVGAGAATPPLLEPPQRGLPEETWEDEDTESSTKKVWGYVGIGVLCAALLAAGIFFTLRMLSGDQASPQVFTPNLKNFTETAAIQILKDNGLEPGQITRVESKEEEKGRVVSQNPSDGTPLAQGGKVSLAIGKGVSMVDVPDVVGMNSQTAERTLQDLNLEFKSKEVPSSDVDKGKALEQDPPAREQVLPGAVVTVTFGAGQEYTQIPDGLTGKSFDDAVKLLKEAKLTGTEISTPGTQAKGMVLGLGEGFEAGKKVPVNTPVGLKVSDFSLFVMPNLTQKTPDEALAALKAQEVGWLGSTLNQIEVQSTNSIFFGKIYQGSSPECATGQQPEAGKTVAKTVTVTVCVGTPLRVSIPSIVGLKVNIAQGMVSGAPLTNVSWRVQPGVPPSAELANTVISVDPGPGNIVAFNAPVTVIVYGDMPPPSTPSPPPSPSAEAPAPGNNGDDDDGD